jgi:hypothetical protein
LLKEDLATAAGLIEALKFPVSQHQGSRPRRGDHIALAPENLINKECKPHVGWGNTFAINSRQQGAGAS